MEELTKGLLENTEKGISAADNTPNIHRLMKINDKILKKELTESTNSKNNEIIKKLKKDAKGY